MRDTEAFYVLLFINQQLDAANQREILRDFINQSLNLTTINLMRNDVVLS
jgi:hypothetical protein